MPCRLKWIATLVAVDSTALVSFIIKVGCHQQSNFQLFMLCMPVTLAGIIYVSNSEFFKQFCLFIFHTKNCADSYLLLQRTFIIL